MSTSITYAAQYEATSYEVNFLIQIAAFVLLLSIRSKPWHTWCLAGYFLFASLNSLGWWLLSTFFTSSYAGLLYHLRACYVFSPYFFSLFCLNFPRNSMRRESRVYAVLGGLLCLGTFLSTPVEHYNSIPVFNSSLQAYTPKAGWSILLFACSMIVNYTYALTVAMRKIGGSPGTERQAMIAYSLVALFLLLIVLLFFFTLLGRVDYRAFSQALSVGFNLAALLDIVVFLNAFPGRITFMVKVVGVIYVAMLTTLGLFARTAFDHHSRVTFQKAVENARAAIVSRPLENTGPDYVMKSLSNGTAELVFARSTPPDLPKSQDLATFGVNAANRISGHSEIYQTVHFLEGGQMFEAGYSLVSFRKMEMNGIITDFSLAILLVACSTVVLFPVLFWFNLVYPLKRLQAGLESVQSGDYDTTLQPHYADEVGYLAGAFDAMVRSIKKSRSDAEEFAANEHKLQTEMLVVESERRALELALLKRSIQPHFLMNTLNTTLGLITENPGAAQALILALGTEIRKILDLSQENTVTASEEISLCRAHLKVMSMRMERTLLLEVGGFDGHEVIPPLLFLTLVENALTHGASEENVFRMDLKKLRRNEGCQYVFSSPAEPGKAIKSNDGIGLKYIRARLEHAFPARWSLDSSVDGTVYRVTINIQSGVSRNT